MKMTEFEYMDKLYLEMKLNKQGYGKQDFEKLIDKSENIDEYISLLQELLCSKIAD